MQRYLNAFLFIYNDNYIIDIGDLMRLSELMKKDIIRIDIGQIKNKFLGNPRRSILFFEDILANYIKECEDSGYEEQIMEVGRQWGILGMQQIGFNIKKFPLKILFNIFAKKVWSSVGILDDIFVSKKDNLIKIETKNELITRIIGKNKLMLGFYLGTFESFLRFEMKPVKHTQTRENCVYTFRVEREVFYDIEHKGKLYNELNKFQELEGFNLKHGLSSNIFQLKEKNKICFRDKQMFIVECTLFHLLSNRDILSERIAEISYNFFNDIIKSGSNESRLNLLKTLLETMGWGKINIVFKENDINFVIKNLPYGIQPKRDNWNFLIGVIHGYLWLLDRKFKIGNTKYYNKILTITYVK